MAKELSKTVKDALAKIDKDFGKGSVITASSKDATVDVIPTGSYRLDEATGIGGYPRGRIIEIYGPESSGKTTLCLTAIAEEHKRNPDALAAVIDTEHALDLNYAKALGVDMDRLHISQPDYGEQAIEITRRLIQTGEFTIVIVDSVASLVPKAEIEGESGDNKLGLQARLMSQAMRLLVADVEKYNTALFFTNQIREKIGVMFGSPETTTGGNALKFYASMRFDIRKKITNKDKNDVINSNTVNVTIKKNKLAAPFREAKFDIEFGIGINRPKEIFESAVDKNIIVKSGAWYSYDGSNIGQGGENALGFLLDNPELFAEIENKLKNGETVNSQTDQNTGTHQNPSVQD